MTPPSDTNPASSTASPPCHDELVEVRLRGLDLAELRHSQQHHDELFREFALLRSHSSGSGVPHRLLVLIEELRDRFSRYTESSREDIERAAAQGRATVDVVFRVPPSVREATLELIRMLEEADEYCRRGNLLTLAPSPRSIAFRRWYLNEFVAQVEGAPPTPWRQ